MTWHFHQPRFTDNVGVQKHISLFCKILMATIIAISYLVVAGSFRPSSYTHSTLCCLPDFASSKKGVLAEAFGCGPKRPNSRRIAPKFKHASKPETQRGRKEHHKLPLMGNLKSCLVATPLFEGAPPMRSLDIQLVPPTQKGFHDTWRFPKINLSLNRRSWYL